MDLKNTMQKAMQTMFRPIDNVSYDLQTGQTGIKNTSGLITLGKDDVLDQNPMDFFSLEIPAFAMLTPANEVKRGDILVSEGKAYGFILEPGMTDTDDAKASIQTMNVQGHISRFRPKRVSMLGVRDGLTIVRSFGSMFGGSSNEGGAMDMNSLLPLMMMSGDKDMKSMLPMLMMMNQGGGQSGGMFSNPLMMMMLMGDGDFKNPFG